MKFEIIHDSVVNARTEAVVNAANEYLTAGGGLCGEIFKINGKRLEEECQDIGFCKTGDSVITNAYNMKARYLIHAVGPKDGDKEVLRNTFISILETAENNHIRSVALVPVATGIFGFPIEDCAKIALDVILNFDAKSIEECYMYCYTQEEYDVFINTLNNIKNAK